MMNKILLLYILLVCSCSRPTDELPNIVLIIGDDHGWPYYGFMGNTIVETPTLDTLAMGGMVFSNG